MEAQHAVTLSAVQVQSRPGEIVLNLSHALPMVEAAAARGATLVALPEMFATGYIPNPSVWDVAEPPDGETARWLASTGKRLGIYVGAGTVEADGSDFYNVYLLADPQGRIAGRSYKTNAEANVFRRGRTDHVIETPIGRIGIGICADNQFVAQLQQMHDQNVDLILMPHAWPTPSKAAGLVSEKDVADQQRRMIELPALYARALGVPVVFVNQVGPLLPVGGILGHLMDTRIWRLRGQSRIVDSDGSELARLGDQEDLAVAGVSLDPTRKHYSSQPSYDGWLQRGAAPARKIFIPLDIRLGRRSYERSAERKRKAAMRAALTARKPSGQEAA
jgi:N-carbamoylputrescine amidase